MTGVQTCALRSEANRNGDPEKARDDLKGLGDRLDQLTPDELARFTRLNTDYVAKFGFPFIIAVKGRGRQDILDAFEHRLRNDHAQELETALQQIERIALLRLQDRLP